MEKYARVGRYTAPQYLPDEGIEGVMAFRINLMVEEGTPLCMSPKTLEIRFEVKDLKSMFSNGDTNLMVLPYNYGLRTIKFYTKEKCAISTQSAGCVILTGKDAADLFEYLRDLYNALRF